MKNKTLTEIGKRAILEYKRGYRRFVKDWDIRLTTKECDILQAKAILNSNYNYKKSTSYDKRLEEINQIKAKLDLKFLDNIDKTYEYGETVRTDNEKKYLITFNQLPHTQFGNALRPHNYIWSPKELLKKEHLYKKRYLEMKRLNYVRSEKLDVEILNIAQELISESESQSEEIIEKEQESDDATDLHQKPV